MINKKVTCVICGNRVYANVDNSPRMHVKDGSLCSGGGKGFKFGTTLAVESDDRQPNG